SSRRRHTRWPRDWSSDVCSSDLLRVEHGVATRLDVLQAQQVLDSANAQIPDLERQIAQEENAISILLGNYPQAVPLGRPLVEQPLPPEVPPGDRKSTRLNSSHVAISYAVFCLKKKK